MPGKARDLQCKHLQAPEAREGRDKEESTLWLLHPRLAGGESCTKRDLGGKQRLIIKALKDARPNLLHEICKTHCSRAG